MSEQPYFLDSGFQLFSTLGFPGSSDLGVGSDA